jgi:hypothetical protein
MNEIVIPEDDMRRLEKQFGPLVRQIGAWNSDGVFSYTTIPVVVLEQAAETLGDATLSISVAHLTESVMYTRNFVQLVENFGPILIDTLAVSYRTYLQLGLCSTRAALVCRSAG